jgi:hypothetical protein
MPLPKLGLISTSSFNRSWSWPVAATFAFHIASVALATSAVTAAGSRIYLAAGARHESKDLQSGWGVTCHTDRVSPDVKTLIIASEAAHTHDTHPAVALEGHKPGTCAVAACSFASFAGQSTC